MWSQMTNKEHVVGAFEAKTHLSDLLARVADGERIVITRRGKPVAMLVPPELSGHDEVGDVVERMLAHRRLEGPKLGKGITLRQLREQGRRF